jgi:capsular polysaccharide biosynthesis protein
MQNPKIFLFLDHCQVLKQRNVAYDLIDFATMTFREQVVAMSKAKLLIAPHGAGLSNVMFMPAGGAVIELTSSRSFLPDLYGKIAHACGLRLFLLPGTKTIPGLAKEWKNCQKTFDCRHQFRCPFEVDIPRFDALLQDVLAIQ